MRLFQTEQIADNVPIEKFVTTSVVNPVHQISPVMQPTVTQPTVMQPNINYTQQPFMQPPTYNNNPMQPPTHNNNPQPSTSQIINQQQPVVRPLMNNTAAMLQEAHHTLYGNNNETYNQNYPSLQHRNPPQFMNANYGGIINPQPPPT